jgi:HK97 family phage major capsid protein
MIFDPDLKKRNMSKIQEIKDRVEAVGREMTGDERALVSNLLIEIDENAKRGTREPSKIDPSSGMQIGTNRAGLKPFDSIGEQFRSIAMASVPGGQVDPRLHEINQRAASGLSEALPSDGAFILQQNYADGILENVFAEGQVLSRIRRIELSGNGNALTLPGVDETSRATGSRQGGIRGYWLAEAAEITASKPQFRQINLKLSKLGCLIYTTEELLQDVSALGSYIEAAAAREIDFQLTDAVINGDGSGKPLGLLNSACLVSQAAEAEQAASTIQFQNVAKMWSRLLPSSASNAVWLIHSSCMPQLMSMSTDGSGNTPVWLPARGLSAPPFGTLMGRPVIPVEQCQALGTLGDIILCDLREYVGITKALRSAWSMHVRFQFDEEVFKIITRFDGQPALASAITPFSGSDSLSPFVALATRD